MKTKRNMYSVLFFLLIVLYSCENKKEDLDTPDLSFDSVVDSSFVCNIEINEEQKLYTKHLLTRGFIERIFESDSIIVGFNMYFEEEQENEINIKISRKFALDSMSTFTVDGFVFINSLPNKQFRKIFDQNNYYYAKYDNTYIYDGAYYEYYSFTSSGSSHELYYPQITQGAAIEFKYLDGALADTKFLIEYLDNDSIEDFYANSYFRLTDINFLDDCNVIISGNFEVELFNIQGEKFHINCTTFKGFIQNYISTNCR